MNWKMDEKIKGRGLTPLPSSPLFPPPGPRPASRRWALRLRQLRPPSAAYAQSLGRSPDDVACLDALRQARPAHRGHELARNAAQKNDAESLDLPPPALLIRKESSNL